MLKGEINMVWNQSQSSLIEAFVLTPETKQSDQAPLSLNPL